MGIEKYLYYDESSPTCLRWAVDVYSGRGGRRKNVSAGDVAGTVKSDGYTEVQVCGKLHKCHIVVWLLHVGTLPKGEIDHENGDRSDNKISNLRDVSSAINNRNRKKHTNNSSGVTGVSLRKCKKEGGCSTDYWMARWNDLDGNRCAESFSVSAHGYEQAFQLACQRRTNVISELNVSGAGYTEAHGV